MSNEATIFGFQAEVGLTKQLGGLEATEELARLCHIDAGSYVLDVGCGVGVTPCYLAKEHGCRVVGVDISDTMIQRAGERAQREGLEDRVEFRVADVQNLPFGDGLFDAVIAESVIAFPEDKQRAVNQCVRVTKPGGYVGFNESTWVQSPPPPELVEWVSQDLSGYAEVLPPEGWVRLLEGAGLRDVLARTHRISTGDEARNLIRRYGWMEMLGIWWRMLRLYIGSPAYRSFVKKAGGVGPTPEHLDEYFGYGLYVGRK